MKWLVLGVLVLPLGAQALTPNAVVATSLQHFPQVIEAVQALEESSQQVKTAEGAFDGRLKGEVDSRTKGYYDGDGFAISVEKPFAFLNSKIYGGRRQSFGEFPDYEGKFETLSQGEVFAGVSVSLLRDSLIDGNRYNLWLRQQDNLQSELQLKLMQINVQTMVLKAYWTWVIKGAELKVNQNILALAETRVGQLEKRIRAGDLAQIYQVENNQYIRKRQAQVVQSQLEFQTACYYLSLFYRDEKGQPLMVGTAELPELGKQQLAKIADDQKVFAQAIKANLQLQILESQKKQAGLDVRMGQNEILPKVDLNFEWNQDQGTGPTQLAQDENRILLNIEVPLEYNRGLGKKRAGQAKISQLLTKESWLKEKLRAHIQSQVLKLNSFASVYELTLDQVKFADNLGAAEVSKFARGASDLILVNLREETLAEAQIKNLTALLKYHFVDAELKDSTVTFITKP